MPKTLARGNGRASWHRAPLRDRAEALGGTATTSITGELSPTHMPSKVSTLGKTRADWERGRDPAEWTDEGVGEHKINMKVVLNSGQEISLAQGVQESHPLSLKSFSDASRLLSLHIFLLYGNQWEQPRDFRGKGHGQQKPELPAG